MKDGEFPRREGKGMTSQGRGRGVREMKSLDAGVREMTSQDGSDVAGDDVIGQKRRRMSRVRGAGERE